MGWHNEAAKTVDKLLEKLEEDGIAPSWLKQIVYEEDAEKKWKAIIFDPR